MAGQRIQDWTNKNIFVNSLDWISEPSSNNHLHNIMEHREVGASHTSSNADGEYTNENFLNVNETDRENDVIKQETDGDELPEKTITSFQAVWNVTNAIQGMFIVGLPFAVKVGGWFAVFALIMVAYICYRTGLALVDCLYEDAAVPSKAEPPEQIQILHAKDVKQKKRTKVRHSYRQVADAVRPGLGRLVLAAQLTELTSTCILYLVLAGDLLQSCIPSVDRSAWMMLVTCILLGTAFLTDIRIVSELSFANAISHLAVNVIMVIYCFSQMDSWHLSYVAVLPNFRLFPTVMGVVVFGYTSHIFLPSLEASMQDPSEFRWMLSQSHIAAALFKAVFGLIGFLTFADFTQKEISNSLPNQTFKVLVNLILVTKALLSYPLPYYAAVQLLTQNFFCGAKKTWFLSCFGADRSLRDWALCLRIILILWTLMMALSVPYLIEFMGLIGNITGTVLSFVWPAYFHLKLKSSELSENQQRFDKFVIGLGVGLCVVGVYYSAVELRVAINANADILEN